MGEIVVGIISCIIAGISIGASYYTWKKTNEYTKEVNEKLSGITITMHEKNLNQKYFDAIFMDKLVKEIPELLHHMEYSSNIREESIEKMQEVVFQLIQDGMFYKYFDECFYEDFKGILIEIDEILVKCGDVNNNCHLSEEYKNEIKSNFHKFYSVVRSYYSKV